MHSGAEQTRPRIQVSNLVRASFLWPARVVSQPLTLSQMLSSASGAGLMLIGASAMEPSEFALFALFTLTSLMLVNLFREALFQPALIARRLHENAYVPLRYALIAALFSVVAMLGTTWAFGVRDPASLAGLAVSAAFPVFFDWQRYRAIGQDRRWAVAHADLIRFVLTIAALASAALCSNAVALQIYGSALTVVPMVFLLLRLPRIARWEPYRTYRRAAGWQLVDFAFGSTLIAVPLLFLGGAGEPESVSGVRLAQSLLGPLNLALAAAASNLVADGVTRAEFASPRAIISRGIALGRLLAGLAILLVASLILVVAATGFAFRGVSNSALLLGLSLVGAALITNGWSSINAIVLRILDRQGRVTLGRAIIAVLTVTSFVVGYALSGTTASLVAGFLTLAVASPLVFITMSARSYPALQS